jgi:hypothetical protein
MRQTSFEDDREKSYDELIWDDDDDDDCSSTTPEGSGAVPEDDGSEEMEGEGETLGHSSKSFHPSSLRDWFEDDDYEQEPFAALDATTIHVAAAAAARGRIPPVVVLPDSPVRQPAAIEPETSEKPGGGVANSKKRAQPSSKESVKKRKRPEPAAKADIPPKQGKKVIKQKAIEVDG